MYLVYFEYACYMEKDFCVICESEEAAKEYISKKKREGHHDGVGIYFFIKIPVFTGREERKWD